MWDALRRQLGEEFTYHAGHWFCVAHEVALRSDGYAFSQKAGGTGRRVVLATEYGPNATLYARSTSWESPFAHDAHDHGDDPGRCCITKRGWINLRIPISVSAEELCDATYSCEEPAGTGLLEQLEKRHGP